MSKFERMDIHGKPKIPEDCGQSLYVLVCVLGLYCKVKKPECFTNKFQKEFSPDSERILRLQTLQLGTTCSLVQVIRYSCQKQPTPLPGNVEKCVFVVVVPQLASCE